MNPDRATGQDQFVYDSYHWMDFLPKPAWGWEFLRRDPAYCAAYQSSIGSPANGQEASLYTGEAGKPWSLCAFEDPRLDVRLANVLWRPESRRDVLPLVAATQHGKGEAGTFSFEGLQCRVTILRERSGDRCHVLFAQDGRSLQLEICGASHLEDGVLLTAALPPLRLRVARHLAARQLADLMKHRQMRAALYPAYRRNARLKKVVQALDGAMAGASQRDIALALVGKRMVERDWQGAHSRLRDHVRKTLNYGRELTGGGYRRLLT